MKVEKKVFLTKIRHSLRRIEVTVSCLINHKKRIEAKLATAVNYATPITKGMQQGGLVMEFIIRTSKYSPPADEQEYFCQG